MNQKSKGKNMYHIEDLEEPVRRLLRIFMALDPKSAATFSIQFREE